MHNRLIFKPKFDKIVELLLYLSHRKPGVDHYAASKYVYLADREHFNKYGRPITFDKYGAMPWGPVALNTYQLLKQEKPTMRNANITELPFETERVDKQILVGAPKRAVNYDVFSESDLEVFDHVLKVYGGLSMMDLHRLTKEHFAYRKAWEGRRAGSKLAAILYEDILEESATKEALIEDLEPIAHRM